MSVKEIDSIMKQTDEISSQIESLKTQDIDI